VRLEPASRQNGQAGGLVARGQPIPPNRFGEIDRALQDAQQRIAGGSFRLDHVVAFELDVRILEVARLARLLERDRRAVDQVSRHHQGVVDEEVLPERQIKIGMRDVWPKG
jgi:hypothetical protein